MAEQTNLVMISAGKGFKGVAGAVAASEATSTELSGVREATTGQVVATLEKVWAVAATEAPASLERKARPLPAPKLELSFYRKYTEGLLRRYVQMTMEAGRVPSMLGRSVLGGRASSYRIHGFDDAVIFRLDVEKCLRRLDAPEYEVVRRVAMLEYTQAEAAAVIGICLRTCVQRYGRAMDKLTGILLEARLLEPFRGLSSGRG